MLKFYQSQDVFSCYYASYKVKEHKAVRGTEHYNPLNYRVNNEHALIYLPTHLYELTDEGRRDFPEWAQSYSGILNQTNQNDKFKQIVKLYLDSFLLGDSSQSFLMLSIVLEMVFGATQELSYRISRGVSLFLSSTREEMSEKYNQVRKLYEFRSKYVHEGKRIKDESIYELREIVRRIIVHMYEKNMHVIGSSYKRFLAELTFDGYSPGH